MKCKIKYLSPTSLATFENASDRFVMTYVANLPRTPQLRVMAVGSAFDAYVKGAIAEDLLDQKGVAEQLMQEQVIETWRIEVDGHGRRLLKLYKSSGAYNKLLKEMEGSEDVAFEFDAKTVLPNGVPIAGKPDLAFSKIVDGQMVRVIDDWKVSGFYSKASPTSGYSRLLDAKGNNRGPHRDCMVFRKHGFDVGIGGKIKPEWEDQITMYSWCLESPAQQKSVWILGIDQLVLQNLTGKYEGPQGQTFKVAGYRRVRKDNAELMERLKRAWDYITQEWYYPHMTLEESQDRTNQLTKDEQLVWALQQQ